MAERIYNRRLDNKPVPHVNPKIPRGEIICSSIRTKPPKFINYIVEASGKVELLELPKPKSNWISV